MSTGAASQRAKALKVVEPKMLRIETPKASRIGREWEGCFHQHQLTRSLYGSSSSGVRGGAMAAKHFGEI